MPAGSAAEACESGEGETEDAGENGLLPILSEAVNRGPATRLTPAPGCKRSCKVEVPSAEGIKRASSLGFGDRQYVVAEQGITGAAKHVGALYLAEREVVASMKSTVADMAFGVCTPEADGRGGSRVAVLGMQQTPGTFTRASTNTVLPTVHPSTEDQCRRPATADNPRENSWAAPSLTPDPPVKVGGGFEQGTQFVRPQRDAGAASGGLADNLCKSRPPVAPRGGLVSTMASVDDDREAGYRELVEEIEYDDAITAEKERARGRTARLLEQVATAGDAVVRTISNTSQPPTRPPVPKPAGLCAAQQAQDVAHLSAEAAWADMVVERVQDCERREAALREAWSSFDRARTNEYTQLAAARSEVNVTREKYLRCQMNIAALIPAVVTHCARQGVNLASCAEWSAFVSAASSSDAI